MTTTKINPLNHQTQSAARGLTGLMLVVACLALTWTALKPLAETGHRGLPAAAEIPKANVPYDLAHSADYRTTVLFYTTSKTASALPF